MDLKIGIDPVLLGKLERARESVRAAGYYIADNAPGAAPAAAGLDDLHAAVELLTEIVGALLEEAGGRGIRADTSRPPLNKAKP